MNKEIINNIENTKEQYFTQYYETMMAYEKIILIGKNNNGYITSKQVSQNNISREYLRTLEHKNMIEKVARGIYILPGTVPDHFYIFQLKYPKTIFSHGSALYLYNLTEEYPYQFDITCSRDYNVKSIKNNQIFYIDKNLITLGKTTIKTKYGNLVNTYNLERTICDIIRNSNRMDEEQMIKNIRNIISRGDINMTRLSNYSMKLKCHDKVMNILRYYDK